MFGVRARRSPRKEHAADRPALAQQRHAEHRADAGGLDRVARIRGNALSEHVWIVDQLSVDDRCIDCRNEIERSRKARTQRAQAFLGHSRGRDELDCVATDECHAHFCVAEQLASRLCDRIEYRLRIGRRLADDLENFGGRGLALERFLRLVEQARVLDRYHGLVGEGLEQRGLLIGKGPGLGAWKLDRADRDAVAHQRDAQHGADADPAEDGKGGREFFRVRLDVLDVNRSRLQDRPAGDGLAAERSPVDADGSGRDGTVMGREHQIVAIQTEDRAVGRVAQPGRAFRDGVEHRLDV